MPDVICNISKGKWAALIQNVEDGSPANSRLKLIPLEASGLEADATIVDHDTVALLLAGTTNEQTTLGRKTLAAADITIGPDDTNNWMNVDFTDQTWAASAGNAISAVLLAYFPDGVTPGADSTGIPIGIYAFVATPDGTDIVMQFAAGGAARAT